MRRDRYHHIVREALEKDGWVITHDPFFIRLGKRKGFIDLGAEIIGAEKGTEKIAVEFKSFTGLSDVDDFEDALGQFLLYILPKNLTAFYSWQCHVIFTTISLMIPIFNMCFKSTKCI